jgi:diguanylate cyclase
LHEGIERNEPMSLIMTDIDHFKSFNDTWGHLTGDQVLRLVAMSMKQNVKGQDTAARYGGEEFAVICREIEGEGVRVLGERLRRAIEQHRFEYDGKVIPVTVSVGAAVDSKTGDAQALIAAADAAMYEAKRAGRNRVCLHAPAAAD